MKVVFLVSSLMHGGVERTVLYLSEYFASKGVDTTILSIKDYIFYDVDSSVKVKTLNVSGGYKNVFDRVVKIFKRLKLVDAFLKAERPDVVFCMSPTVCKYIFGGKKKYKFKLITSERNYPLYDTRDEKQTKEKAFRVCEGIVFQTDRAKNMFSENVQNKSVVIPNAVGNPVCYTLKAQPFKEKKFSAIGRLSRQKDYPTMIRAFTEFHKTHPEYRLEIFGSGEDEEELKRLAAELKVKDSVLFMGLDKNAIERIADSTAFLLSSIYEGMPNVLLEAMAIGLPCISTDCPFGPKELINDGVNGILVPVGDYMSLAAAMERVIIDKAAALSMGEKARDVLKTNDISAISEKYLSYVLRICEQSDDQT